VAAEKINKRATGPPRKLGSKKNNKKLIKWLLMMLMNVPAVLIEML
jgi:hypothetical protein